MKNKNKLVVVARVELVEAKRCAEPWQLVVAVCKDRLTATYDVVVDYVRGDERPLFIGDSEGNRVYDTFEEALVAAQDAAARLAVDPTR